MNIRPDAGDLPDPVDLADTVLFDLDALLDSMPPATRRNHDRRMRVFRLMMTMARLLRWPRWPLLNLVWVFWTSLMDEGVRSTLMPRYGALTFCYLNDGIRPTLYHMIRSILDPDTPIYPRGAPRNAAEAR